MGHLFKNKKFGLFTFIQIFSFMFKSNHYVSQNKLKWYQIIRIEILETLCSETLKS